MKLLTKELLRKLPPLYSTEKLGDSAVAQLKLFTPWSSWSWFATEYDPETRVFFGWVVGPFPELGYFSLDELEAVKGPFGLKVERDKFWKPKSLAEVKKGVAA